MVVSWVAHQVEPSFVKRWKPCAHSAAPTRNVCSKAGVRVSGTRNWRLLCSATARVSQRTETNVQEAPDLEAREILNQHVDRTLWWAAPRLAWQRAARPTRAAEGDKNGVLPYFEKVVSVDEIKIHRKRPSQERSRATVDAICLAAIRVLKSEASPSTRRIARIAGVSVGTLYQYFSDQEAVLAELVRRQLTAMGEAMDVAMAKHAGHGLRAQVYAIVEAFARSKASDPGLNQALAMRLHAIAAMPIVVSFKAAILAHVLAMLEAHRDEIAVGHLLTAAQVVVDAVDGALFAEVMRGGARLSDPVFVGEVADLAVRYLCG